MKTTLPKTTLYTKKIGLALIGSLLMIIASKVTVPVGLIKLSLAPLVPLLLGYFMGSSVGMLSVLFFLGEGLMGLPVFQSSPERGVGLVYILGPTGGYLLSWPLAAYFTGFVKERGWFNKNLFVAFSLVLGLYHIQYVMGLSWLAILGFKNPLIIGYMPFVSNTIAHVILMTSLVKYKK